MSLRFKVLLFILGLSSTSAVLARYYYAPATKLAINTINKEDALGNYMVCHAESDYMNPYGLMESCDDFFNTQLAKIDISDNPHHELSYQKIGILYKQVQRKKKRMGDTPLKPLHQLTEPNTMKKVFGASL